ncbi:uncharacterized protein K02A2.6-like [Mizuhopecten yessoensis]|uniref:uncharacterized protein K02A2.6-like n=1 Tax=Mizuhopecten yessoensis TaxID=6573 RepID=UPI000B457AA4|nr:uncharacterized protein K02A2.6-like [Mizuhopecten yessoensis]
MAMRSSAKDHGSINKKLSNFLLAYRYAPHTTTNETQAKLFMGRNLCTRLDLIKPNIQRHVEDAQSRMVEKRHDTKRSFEPGQTVAIRDYRLSKPLWTSGTISSRTGPVSYHIDVAPGVFWRRHLDQLRDSNVEPSSIEYEPIAKQTLPTADHIVLPEETTPPTSSDSMAQTTSDSNACPNLPEKSTVDTPIRRNPKRNAGTPKKFDGFVKF